MDHENSDTTKSEITNGWVKTTQTIVTWQEQPEQISDLLAEDATLADSLAVTQDQALSIIAARSGIAAKLSALGYVPDAE